MWQENIKYLSPTKVHSRAGVQSPRAENNRNCTMRFKWKRRKRNIQVQPGSERKWCQNTVLTTSVYLWLGLWTVLPLYLQSGPGQLMTGLVVHNYLLELIPDLLTLGLYQTLTRVMIVTRVLWVWVWVSDKSECMLLIVMRLHSGMGYPPLPQHLKNLTSVANNWSTPIPPLCWNQRGPS